ncbi:MAG: polyphenol oxidase family protein [Pseudomonadota bacterium]
MKRLSQNSLVFYRFASLEVLGLNHAVFTRLGGVSSSEAPYHSLNLSYSVGDNPEWVRENRTRAAAVLGLSDLCCARQVHGREAVVIPAGAAEGECGEADALLTGAEGRGLMIKQADCQAVLIFEPERRVLANVHCGWRGSVTDILGHTVARLREVFGADPQKMHAGIAPSLGPCCAEFRDWRTMLPAWFAGFRASEDHFDFWRISAAQLVRAGIAPENIETPGICTRCSGEFYSYRREGRTGRFATVGVL